MLRSVTVIGARLMVGLIGISAALPALADDAFVPEIRLQKEETNGWSLKSFDFGYDDINFETYVPDTAKMETTTKREFDASKEIGASGSSERSRSPTRGSKQRSRGII